MSSVHDFTVADPAGRQVHLSDYRGRVLLIVNTASQCGFTPHYAGLEQLHRDLGPRGLSVLGFPCNQFGAQEPGDAAEIADFCTRTYGVTFPIFAKIEVNGPGAAPVFVWLKDQARGLLGTRAIKWNFTKFLVDREGGVRARYAPRTRPEAIRHDIERLL